MPSAFNFNNSIDPDANHFSELDPSLEGDINSQYFDSNSFKASQANSSCEDFSVIYLNVNFLRANGDKFLSFLSTIDHKFDVISLSETYLKQREKLDYYFPNYKMYNFGRSNRKGGGVMICVGCELISLLTANLPYIESVAVKMTLKNKRLMASTVYRPPKSNFDLFHSFVESNFPARELQSQFTKYS